jgi:hypothetical protein
LVLLSKIERAYLSGTREFTKKQQRDIRYRLRKKLKTLGEELQPMGISTATTIESRDAAAEFRDDPHMLSEAQVYGTERSLKHEMFPKERRSPSSSAWQSEGFVNLRL